MDNVKLEVVKEFAAPVLVSAPVPYIRDAKLRGSLFGEVDDGTVSSVFTDFYVDHTEPLEALMEVQKRGTVWPFGELLEGHEFLLIIKPQSRRDDQHSSDF
jgi:hypothetical protein